MTSKPHIIVLGYVTKPNDPLYIQLAHVPSAGVTGLTSSIFLAEEGYQVTIVASHVPGDESIEYTSPWYVYRYIGPGDGLLMEVGPVRTGELLPRQTNP